MSISALVELFITWGEQKYTPKSLEVYSVHLRRFAKFADGKNIETIKSTEVIAYAKDLQAKGFKGNTLNLGMIALRQLWKYAHGLEQELNIRVPFMPHMIPIKFMTIAESHKPISEEEFADVISVIQSSQNLPEFTRLRDETMFRFLYDTGVRVSECTAVNVSDLDLERGSCKVITRKRRDMVRYREVYLTEETILLLKAYLQERASRTSSDALFINVRQYGRITRRSVQRIMEYYCKVVGTGRRTPHSFRHGFGMRAAESQMYLPHLQALLGHRNPQSSQTYYNLKNESIRKEYQAKIGNSKKRKLPSTCVHTAMTKAKPSPSEYLNHNASQFRQVA